MKFDCKEFLHRMINVMINLDAISDPVMPNFKVFSIVVGMLTEGVRNSCELFFIYSNKLHFSMALVQDTLCKVC
jgi:hypothetical protein